MKYFRSDYFLTKIGFAAFILTLSLSCEQGTSHKQRKIQSIHSAKPIDIDALNQKIKTTFDSSVSGNYVVWEGDTVNVFADLQKIYKDGNSFWFTPDGINEVGTGLLAQLSELYFDGIDTSIYKISELNALCKSIESVVNQDIIFDCEMKLTNAFLRSSHDLILGCRLNRNKEMKNANDSLFDPYTVLRLAVKSDDMESAFEQMRPRHPWYKQFRNEYKRLANGLKNQAIEQINLAKDSLTNADSSAQIVLLRKRLHQNILLPRDTTSGRWDEEALNSLKKYQHQHQLRVTGRLDTATIRKLNEPFSAKMAKLALNMERMRWLRHQFTQPYIWVDIPKMEMDYINRDSIEFNMRVVVGRPSRPTPALDAKIQNVVLSPPWNVPPTIMREEVVPGIARRGGAYLSRRGLRAYDRRGRPVSASAINSSNYRNFSIGQAPGYHSSLGEVKFNMPNPWAIYMHDTPHREDFVKFYRAFSSGCVRVHKPKEFATFLLQDSIRYSFQKIDSICKLRKTIFVPVNRQIDVHFVYLTNALDSAGNIMYLRDIYGWDQ